jgi:hypothetical protein
MSIQIQGLEQLFRKFGVVQSKRILRPPMQRAVYRLVRRMATYPPAPADSKYVRQGILGKGWHAPPIKEFPDGLEGKVANKVIYGPLVQSSRFQTRQHRQTGWLTDAQAVREEEGAIVRDFQVAVNEALNR